MNENSRSVFAAAQIKLKTIAPDAGPSPTPELIRDTVARTVGFFGFDDVDIERVAVELERAIQTRVGSERVMQDKDLRHAPWLKQKKASIEWKFWYRYERYLRETENWASEAVESLDRTTDRILDLLVDPAKDSL